MSEQVRKRPGEPLSLWAQFSVFVAASCRRQLAANIRTVRLLHAAYRVCTWLPIYHLLAAVLTVSVFILQLIVILTKTLARNSEWW